MSETRVEIWTRGRSVICTDAHPLQLVRVELHQLVIRAAGRRTVLCIPCDCGPWLNAQSIKSLARKESRRKVKR